MEPATTVAARALMQWLAALDAEAWDVIADWLDEDVQLADELTTEWLRGRERAGAYLRASEGVVTDIVSTPSHLAVTELGPDSSLVTFKLQQRYRLDGDARNEHSTGSAIFRVRDGRPRLALFHLAPVRASDQEAAPVVVVEEPASQDPDATFVLGRDVRRRRMAADLSLRELAERTGLSPSFLSQVERSLADPSVTSLRRIADGLGIDVVALLGRERAPVASAVREGRRGERPRVYVGEAELTIEGFGGFPDGDLEAYIAEPARGSGSRRPAHVTEAEEFVYVLHGMVELVAGQRTVVLREEDGAHVRGGIPLRVAPAEGSPARYLVIRARAGG